MGKPSEPYSYTVTVTRHGISLVVNLLSKKNESSKVKYGKQASKRMAKLIITGNSENLRRWTFKKIRIKYLNKFLEVNNLGEIKNYLEMHDKRNDNKLNKLEKN